MFFVVLSPIKYITGPVFLEASKPNICIYLYNDIYIAILGTEILKSSIENKLELIAINAGRFNTTYSRTFEVSKTFYVESLLNLAQVQTSNVSCRT